MEDVPEPETIDYDIANIGPWTVLRFSLWSEFSLGQTTSLTGSTRSGFSSPSERNNFLSHFPFSYHEAEQVHGTEVRLVRTESSCYIDTDGLVSPGTRQLLTILTADCIPVFIKALRSTRYGLLHVGWRGLVQGIIPNSLSEYFEGPVEVLMGSGIHQADYEVGEEVINELSNCFECSKQWLEDTGILDDKSRLDLFQAILHQFDRIDLSVSRFLKVPLNTANDEGIPLPSYRRNKTDARTINWIVKRATR